MRNSITQFQHTAARRRLVPFGNGQAPTDGFNTQPPEGGWVRSSSPSSLSHLFQHTAARRRLGPNIRHPTSPPPCFNTQPPEGGWYGLVLPVDHDIWFQHTAARRRLDFRRWVRQHNKFVSTHSRPKAAGLISLIIVYPVRVSTHSRPKAAGTAYQRQQTQVQFQHTAARRRLGNMNRELEAKNFVSTHSRPKAAGYRCYTITRFKNGFNTQPPEGGWYRLKIFVKGC